MTIGWPQGILIAISAVNFLVAIRDNGKPKGDHDPVVAGINLAVVYGLLWWGGFFGR